MFPYKFWRGSRTHRNVVVSSWPILLADGLQKRKKCIIQNQGSTPVYLGRSGDHVTTSGANVGLMLAPGESLTDEASREPWVARVGAIGSANVHVIIIT